MQIAAMHDGIGVAEACAEDIAEIDMGDFLRAQRIHQAELVDIDSHVARGLADAEIVEGVEGIRAELNARADLAELGGLFQQDRTKSFLRQPERGSEAADAAARNQDRLRARRHQPALPRCSSASSARSGTREASLLRSTSCESSAISALRSAGFRGCSIRACARSTAGMISRSRVTPALVRYKSLTRLSSGAGLRSTYVFACSRSITLPSVERSNAITAESRVASMPGWVRIAISAAYCTGVRSKALHSSMKIATAICCIRRNR